MESLGYKLLTNSELSVLRKKKHSVLLYDILERQMRKINKWRYKGDSFDFTDKNIFQAIKDIDDEPLTEGLIKANERILESLLYGKAFQEKLPDGNGFRSFNINYIDWETPSNNVFHIAEELIVERQDTKDVVRPDIVLFVNGIPLAVIENKSSKISSKQAIQQMIRNQGKEYIPQLFKFSQILMATNSNETKYATCYTPQKFWSVWKEENEEWLEGHLKRAVIDRTPTNQDRNLISLFHPERLLELTRYFTLFDGGVKKIARYQQYFAIKAIIKQIQERDADGNRKSGVIWHTQGSGKSLTMVMLTRYIQFELAKYQPQIIIITDRVSLDKQIHKTFLSSDVKATRAESGKKLVELIKDHGSDVITSLVHKFNTAAKYQDPVESDNVFVLIDESHRTQYGELNRMLRKVFPNACYVGFTGTPLMKEQKKNTIDKFGGLIHQYTIKDGVNDKAIVPLIYEGKMVEQTANAKGIDTQLNIITRNLNDKQKAEVKQKWSRLKQVLSSEQRLNLVAFDINEHFNQNYKLKSSQFKAMFACSSRPEAVKYKQIFDELGDLRTEVIVSPPDMREGQEVVDKKSQDIFINFWKEMMEIYGDEESYESQIKNEFVYGDEIDILIVVDKLLTGFDAPRASVLYVDRSLKEHNLLQAIARVNRLYEGKDYGYIIDYRGLIKELDDAMDMYSGAGLENFESEDIKGALVDVIKVVGELREAYTNLTNLFKGIDKNDTEAMQVSLEPEPHRKDFYNKLSVFSRKLGIAAESDKAYEALGEEKMKTYKAEFKYYQELRASVRLRYSDSIDHKEYEAKMRKLIDNYISADSIIRITNPVDILDEEGFDDELNRLGTAGSKADAIRTRMSKSINAHYDENPAYYKKFSEKIKEVLDQYKEMRISEADYLKCMRDIMNEYTEGDTGEEYPSNLKDRHNAQAFYGVINDIVSQIDGLEFEESSLGDVALQVDKIIGDNVQVDFHDNPEIHRKITFELNDYFFTLMEQYQLTFNHIDRLIENIRTVALRRY